MKKILRFAFGDPKKLLTPFNVIAFVILAIGIPITALRIFKGIGAVTNLSQTTPWGLWIGFDVMTGVALAAGGYTIATTVHLFGIKKYEPLVRPAILTGFLGYFFVVVGLMMDLGRPWRMPYVMIYPRGVASVLFLVGWHVLLYLTVQFLEFSPAVAEWLGWKRVRYWAGRLIVWACILGVVLSTLHQSALGALFLLAPTKLHPLWYSPFIPIFFFVSSIIAGLSMVIVESSLSHKIFHYRTSPGEKVDLDALTIGLGKAAAVVLYVYFFIKLIGVADGLHWDLLDTKYGSLFMLEMVGFVLIPCMLYTWGVRSHNVKLVRFTGAYTVLGILFNRLNVSVIAFNWNAPIRYVPSWMEVMVSVTIITIGILTFRWMVNRMPVLSEGKPIEGGTTLKEAWGGKVAEG